MTWQTLTPINLTQAGAYVPLPLAGAGGRVPLQIPPFSVGERGLYEVGIYDLPQGGPPGLVAAAQTAQIAAYTRSLVFEVPPSIAAPHVGIRLLSHDNLGTASYSVAIKWQPPYGSGTGDGGVTPVPSGFMAAISWTEIKQAAIAEIAQGYATVESVTTQLAEIQEAIDALSTNTATQQAIAALATRINALESSDPEQASAITALQQSLSALAAAGATDAELAAGLSAIQDQLGALASDSELASAIAPIQAALNGLGGTYATDSELAAAIASETTAHNAAIAALTRVPPPPIIGLTNPIYLGHYSYYVAGISPQNPSPYQGPRMRRSKAVIRYTIHLVANLTAVIQPRFGGYCAGPSGGTVAWRFIALPNITITPGVFVYENTYLIENIPNNFIGGLWQSLISGSFTGFNSHVIEIWEGD